MVDNVTDDPMETPVDIEPNAKYLAESNETSSEELSHEIQDDDEQNDLENLFLLSVNDFKTFIRDPDSQWLIGTNGNSTRDGNDDEYENNMKVSKSMSHFQSDNSLIERLDMLSQSRHSIALKLGGKRISKSPIQTLDDGEESDVLQTSLYSSSSLVYDHEVNNCTKPVVQRSAIPLSPKTMGLQHSPFSSSSINVLFSQYQRQQPPNPSSSFSTSSSYISLMSRSTDDSGYFDFNHHPTTSHNSLYQRYCPLNNDLNSINKYNSSLIFDSFVYYHQLYRMRNSLTKTSSVDNNDIGTMLHSSSIYSLINNLHMEINDIRTSTRKMLKETNFPNFVPVTKFSISPDIMEEIKLLKNSKQKNRSDDETEWEENCENDQLPREMSERERMIIEQEKKILEKISFLKRQRITTKNSIKTPSKINKNNEDKLTTITSIDSNQNNENLCEGRKFLTFKKKKAKCTNIIKTITPGNLRLNKKLEEEKLKNVKEKMKYDKSLNEGKVDQMTTSFIRKPSAVHKNFLQKNQKLKRPDSLHISGSHYNSKETDDTDDGNGEVNENDLMKLLLPSNEKDKFVAQYSALPKSDTNDTLSVANSVGTIVKRRCPSKAEMKNGPVILRPKTRDDRSKLCRSAFYERKEEKHISSMNLPSSIDNDGMLTSGALTNITTPDTPTYNLEEYLKNMKQFQFQPLNKSARLVFPASDEDDENQSDLLFNNKVMETSITTSIGSVSSLGFNRNENKHIFSFPSQLLPEKKFKENDNDENDFLNKRDTPLDGAYFSPVDFSSSSSGDQQHSDKDDGMIDGLGFEWENEWSDETCRNELSQDEDESNYGEMRMINKMNEAYRTPSHSSERSIKQLSDIESLDTYLVGNDNPKKNFVNGINHERMKSIPQSSALKIAMEMEERLIKNMKRISTTKKREDKLGEEQQQKKRQFKPLYSIFQRKRPAIHNSNTSLHMNTNVGEKIENKLEVRKPITFSKRNRLNEDERRNTSIKSISSNCLEPSSSYGNQTYHHKLNETRSPSKERSSSRDKMKNRPFVNPHDFEKFRNMVANVEANRQRSRSNSQQKSGYVSDGSSTNVSPIPQDTLRRAECRYNKNLNRTIHAQLNTKLTNRQIPLNELTDGQSNEDVSGIYHVKNSKKDFNRFRNSNGGIYNSKPPLPMNGNLIGKHQQSHLLQTSSSNYSEKSISKNFSEVINCDQLTTPIRSSSASNTISKSRLKPPSTIQNSCSLQLSSQEKNKTKSHCNLGIDQRISNNKIYSSNSHHSRLKSHAFSDDDDEYEENMRNNNEENFVYEDEHVMDYGENDKLKNWGKETNEKNEQSIDFHKELNVEENSKSQNIQNKRKFLELRRKTITKESGAIISGIRRPSTSPNSSRAISSNTQSTLPHSSLVSTSTRNKKLSTSIYKEVRDNSPSMSQVSSSTTVNRPLEIISTCSPSNRISGSVRKPTGNPSRKLSYTVATLKNRQMNSNDQLSFSNVQDNNKLLTTSLISQVSDSSDSITRRPTVGHTAKGVPVIAPFEDIDSGISSFNLNGKVKYPETTFSSSFYSRRDEEIDESHPTSYSNEQLITPNVTRGNFQSKLKPISYINKPGFSSEATHRTHLPTERLYSKTGINTFSKMRLSSKHLNSQH
ncbi:hypothetical protein SNEBB_002230 [Seison nebaliae]|nr:hypothetical protein SNEBB_002230 [Seison nebaliae]